MTLRWFFSKEFRHATDLRRQVRAVLNAQRDILSQKAIGELSKGLSEYGAAVVSAPDDGALKAAAGQMERVANQWLKPYPYPHARENIKEFLVSGVLVLTIFSFFVQPMKIPSGSAQPTLFGNVVEDLRDAPASEFPRRWSRFVEWFRGNDYHHWIAKDSGQLRIGPVVTVIGFVKKQTFYVGSDSYTFWFPSDYLEGDCGVKSGQPFAKGDEVLKLRAGNGDRLFVDKVSYNFRRPERGETIVFASTGIPMLIQNTHYIKRLIGLPGDRVRIGNDRHVSINGVRLDASTPRFENVYSFTGPPLKSVYSGHVNNEVARGAAPLFPDEKTEYVVGQRRYLAFGDNTMNSFDGRSWGDFPREKVVGKAFFVFWPLTSRFGLANR